MLRELSDCTKEYNAEQIISAELTAHLEADIKNEEEQAVRWTTRYNEEIVRQQREINELNVCSNVYVLMS